MQSDVELVKSRRTSQANCLTPILRISYITSWSSFRQNQECSYGKCSSQIFRTREFVEKNRVFSSEQQWCCHAQDSDQFFDYLTNSRVLTFLSLSIHYTIPSLTHPCRLYTSEYPSNWFQFSGVVTLNTRIAMCYVENSAFHIIHMATWAFSSTSSHWSTITPSTIS